MSGCKHRSDTKATYACAKSHTRKMYISTETKQKHARGMTEDMTRNSILS